MTDFGLILTYVMIIMTVVACLISPILQMRTNPKKITKMLFPLFILLIVFGISYLIANNEVLPTFSNTNGSLISPQLSKIVGGALIMFYILSLTTIGAVVYSEFLHKLFKNGKK